MGREEVARSPKLCPAMIPLFIFELGKPVHASNGRSPRSPLAPKGQAHHEGQEPQGRVRLKLPEAPASKS